MLSYVLQQFIQQQYQIDEEEIVFEEPLTFPARTRSTRPYLSPILQGMSINPKAWMLNWTCVNDIKFGSDEDYFHGTKQSKPSGEKFIFKGERMCDKRSPFLLVAVPSLPGNRETRDLIRRTWGSVSRTQSWPIRIVNAEVKVIFLLGRYSTDKEYLEVQRESQAHQDIVMGDFVDSYRNLSRKILASLAWMHEFCPGTHYILKCDEDTFVNIPLLVDFLLIHEPMFNYSVIGYVYGKSRVLRSGKWKVDTNAYPMNVYPIYVSGNAYVISRDLALRILHASWRLPYISVEDAYITGILTRAAGGRHVHSKLFTRLMDKRPKPCDFLGDKKLANTGASRIYTDAIWAAYTNNKC
ncbi:beta-1,3-galactosyltransferase 5-like [Haliotis cracherodii]|uniref:beta-1,3-galactosyltransferase 5-like n=1 Tax=Haliotis cracherodii TaxID=6455 RepID=UPI0039EBD5BF